MSLAGKRLELSDRRCPHRFHALVRLEIIMSDLDYLHDAIFDATGKSLPSEKLALEFVNLPERIQREVKEWGMSDTVVRESIWDYYKSNATNELTERS